MPNLRTQLQSITDSFVSAILAAMKRASIRDLAADARVGRGPAPTTSKKPAAKKAVKVEVTKAAKPAPKPAATTRKAKVRGKRSAPNLAAVKDQILAYVKAHANERSEKVRAALKLERPAYLRAVAELIEAKKLTKKGEKRKTTFSTVA